jgi:phosphatidate cytidylyltransferase
MLKKRLITALLIIPLLVTAVWFDEPLPWFTVFVATWGVLAVTEFYRMATTLKVLPLTGFGLIWTFLLILSRDSKLLATIEPHFDLNLLTLLLLTSAIVLPLIWLILRHRKIEAFTSWAWTLIGILYVGWLLGHLVALRGLDNLGYSDYGNNLVFFTIFITFASDSTAFFIGRAWGRHHLAPRISPKKTWEGAIAGVFGAITASLLFNALFNLPFNYEQAILLGVAVSVFGQFGDLVESLFKRNMGVKESGNLLPGHGGFLDRMDSVAFAGVVVYYYVILFGG